MTLPGDLEIRSLIQSLGGSLPAALAVVLTEKGKSPKDKDVEALGSEIEFSITLEQTVQVVEDFFSCNPLHSLFDKLTQAAEKLGTGIKATALKDSASSLPAGTSAGVTQSSGDSPSASANPGSDTGSETSSSAKQ